MARYIRETPDDEEFHAWLSRAQSMLIGILDTSMKDQSCSQLLIPDQPDPNWMLPIADDETVISFLVSTCTTQLTRILKRKLIKLFILGKLLRGLRGV